MFLRINTCRIIYTSLYAFFFFFQAEDGIRDYKVTGVQTCALPISTLTSIQPTPRLAFAPLATVLNWWRTSAPRSFGACKPRAWWQPPSISPDTEIGRASCRERV